MSVRLMPPDPEGWRPTERMEQVSRVVEDEPGLTRNAIRERVGGRASITDEAIRLLLADDFLQVEKRGQARLHRVVKPYRVPGSLPSPAEAGPGSRNPAANRVPGSPPGDPDPVAGSGDAGTPSKPLPGPVPGPTSLPLSVGREA